MNLIYRPILVIYKRIIRVEEKFNIIVKVNKNIDLIINYKKIDLSAKITFIINILNNSNIDIFALNVINTFIKNFINIIFFIKLIMRYLLISFL